MKRQALLLACVIALLFAGKAVADSFSSYVSAGGLLHVTGTIATTPASDAVGVAQASITSIQASVPASSTAVTLSAASTIVDIWTSSDAAPLHINWANGTATSSNAAIAPGSTYRFDTRNSPISAFKVIGDSATGTYNVVAN